MGVYDIGGIAIEIEPRSPLLAARLAPFATNAPPVVTLPRPNETENEITALFRSLCALMLEQFDTLYLHGGALYYQGYAYLFTAPSGTGKSTHLRLWAQTERDARILCGDKPLLRSHAQGCTLFATPWQGKEGWGETGAAPLGAIFVLERGTTDEVAPLSVVEALPHLLGAVWKPEGVHGIDKVLPLLETILATIPVFRLKATPSVGAVTAVKQIISTLQTPK